MPPTTDPKIFGIGLSRTGTRSLARALAILGYKSAHYDIGLKALNISPTAITPNYDKIAAWDALTDIPITATYPQLDRYFSGSRFILTVRDMDSWLKSCKRHHAASRAHYTKQHSIELDNILTLRKAVYGNTRFTRARFAAVYDQHQADALRYFQNRGADLLIFNIQDGAGWDPLCSFLGKPVPEQPFPHENRSNK